MPATVLVINPDDADRRWIASSLVSTAYVAEFFADEAALFARLPAEEPTCLIAFAEPDADAALLLVRELRRRAPTLPVIVLGPHSAFRMAVDVARLPATDFLERPVSSQQLRLAVAKALKTVIP
jgi:FixJ family two-component response regulator